MSHLLDESVRASPVVRFGSYEYFVHPLTDGIPFVDPDLLSEVVEEILAIAELDVERIVTPEAMGIPVGTALALEMGVPLTILRKRSYGLAGEVKVQQRTGYGGAEFTVNGLSKGMRVLLVDDVVSTGGTLSALLECLRAMEVVVADVVILFEKGDGRAAIEKRFGIPVKTICRVEVKDGKAVPARVVRPRP